MRRCDAKAQYSPSNNKAPQNLKYLRSVISKDQQLATREAEYNKKISNNQKQLDELKPVIGGEAKPGMEDDTWNYHWAGVVMKSDDGRDTVTIENNSVGIYNRQNTRWLFQMYGSAKTAEEDPNKRGQTFHEEHRDLIELHGETPTTMKVEPN